MMHENRKCFICGEGLTYNNGYYCSACNIGFNSVFCDGSLKSDLQNKCVNAIFSFLLRRRKIDVHNRYDFIYHDRFEENKETLETQDSLNTINVYDLLKNYPDTLIKRIDETLMNLINIYGDIGAFFPIGNDSKTILYCGSDNVEAEISYLVNMMKSMGYIYFEVDSLDESIYRCQITLTGWQRIEELKTIKKEINQAFIAMKFGETTQPIAEAFKEAISKTGYAPYKMDEIEHNNQIIPEMFYEISRSKFVVVDVTVPNLGAYYEAGYAQALGKEVIVCCRRGEEKQAHFDISQKNLIIWDTYEDLTVKLMKRIESTVGKSV